MNELQRAKARVWRYLTGLSGADAHAVAELLDEFMHPEVSWHGPHPLDTLNGTRALEEGFWRPFLHAFRSLSVRPYLFLGGVDGGSTWVSAAGDLIATFAHDWLGIPATRSSAHMRFGVFYRLEGEKIRETYLLLDLPELTHQAGCPALPPGLGRALWVPGPLAGDGVLHAEQDAATSAASAKLVADMIGGLNRYDRVDKASMGMTRFWHPQTMRWYGPWGIGSTVGLAEFESSHQLPFLRAFPDRVGDGSTAKLAEGRFVAYNGWPAIRATHAGDYLGNTATHRAVTMRCLDWWACEGGKLAENWVLLDLPDLFAQVGVDLFGRLKP